MQTYGTKRVACPTRDGRYHWSSDISAVRLRIYVVVFCMSLETQIQHKQPEAIQYNLGVLQTNSSLLKWVVFKQLSKMRKEQERG